MATPIDQLLLEMQQTEPEMVMPIFYLRLILCKKIF